MNHYIYNDKILYQDGDYNMINYTKNNSSFLSFTYRDTIKQCYFKDVHEVYDWNKVLLCKKHCLEVVNIRKMDNEDNHIIGHEKMFV
jgi:hypothetical protein